jgi:hypothetical protein
MKEDITFFGRTIGGQWRIDYGDEQSIIADTKEEVLANYQKAV